VGRHARDFVHTRRAAPRAHLALDTATGSVPPGTETETRVQLSAYSLTAMRVCGDTNSPFAPAVVYGVTAFIKHRAVSGRVFSRLAEADLNQ
jgi:hypothetical protein